MSPLSVRFKTAVSISIITTPLLTRWTKSCRRNWRKIPLSSQSSLMHSRTWNTGCLVDNRGAAGMLLEAALRTEHSVRNSQCSAGDRPLMPSWLTDGELQDIFDLRQSLRRIGQFPHRRRRGFGERSDLDDLRAVSRFPPARPPSLQLDGAQATPAHQKRFFWVKPILQKPVRRNGVHFADLMGR